jgi:hypothetical protein
MKLRLALAAADASAQSTVTLYGLIENGSTCRHDDSPECDCAAQQHTDSSISGASNGQVSFKSPRMGVRSSIGTFGSVGLENVSVASAGGLAALGRGMHTAWPLC